MTLETPPEIGLVIYPGAQMAAVLGMTDLFGLADRLARGAPARSGEAATDGASPLLRISHWQWAGDAAGPVRVFDTLAGGGGWPAVLVLPPSLDAPLPPGGAAGLAAWVVDRHRAGALLCSVCNGAFVLGETGLLSDRRVTTHWSIGPAFQARFPRVRLDTGRPLIDDGDIVTAGGIMAWTDLALHLVDRLLGAAVRLKVAGTFLGDPPGLAEPPGRERNGCGAFSAQLDHGDAAILRVQRWLEETGARDSGLAALVARSGLEERTFLRRFLKATGLTTTGYSQRLRVARARDLLQRGGLSTEQIAWEVGYADPGAFRKMFTRIVGLTPAEYRKRLRG